MFDKIKSKIEFEVSSEEEARKIYDSICVGNELNLQLISFVGDIDYYCDAVKRVEDEEDKECFWEFVLYDRNYEFWYKEYISCKIGELKWIGDKAAFTFQALSIVPYQVVMSIADRFKVPFTLKHIERTGESWGSETYELDEKERFRSTSGRICVEEDLIGLHIELVGYEPDLAILLRQLGRDLESLLGKFGPDLEIVLRSLDPESMSLLSKFDIT